MDAIHTFRCAGSYKIRSVGGWSKRQEQKKLPGLQGWLIF